MASATAVPAESPTASSADLRPSHTDRGISPGAGILGGLLIAHHPASGVFRPRVPLADPAEDSSRRGAAAAALLEWSAQPPPGRPQVRAILLLREIFLSAQLDEIAEALTREHGKVPPSCGERRSVDWRSLSLLPESRSAPEGSVHRAVVVWVWIAGRCAKSPGCCGGILPSPLSCNGSRCGCFPSHSLSVEHQSLCVEAQ